MDEQLDNELKKRIQQVFENFDDTGADEGWLLLREKFPEKESKRRGLIWLWWGSVAAGLLLFLGIGLWYFTKNDDTIQVKSYTAQSVKHNQSQPVIIKKKAQIDTVGNTHSIAGQQQSQIAGTSNKKNNIGQGAGQQAKQNHQEIAVVQTPGNDTLNKNQHWGSGSVLYSSKSSLIAKNKTTPAHTKVNANKQETEESYQQSIATTSKQKTVKPGKKASSTLPLATTDKATQESLAANDATDNENNPVIKKPQNQVITSAPKDTANTNKIAATPKPPKKTIADMFADDKQTALKKTKDDIKNKDKRVHFGVYAATYFSYAKGSNDEVNVGAGFSSDIKINNNLKLVTGVAIGQNTLSYPGVASTDAAAATSLYTLARPNAVTAAYANYAQVATPSIKNYDANLVGLDIPLNLKYEINPQKSDTYILAGLSSGTFINESYTYFYNYPTLNSSTLQQTQGATTNKSFDSFYFAKTLNLAFGIGYPIGKNHLIVEPFLKYPLEGLGSQQIRFGSGGINLKFNFSTKK
ncbi:hypothetical protein HDF24_21660 [Mucilaginibacter sp. X4EP1]|uniref:hypothetical protein n=1 Tax=Mucilaginibacter sp. X4EP1 TaxID=2723092 RepID=UPI002167CD4D|nr:hypothetical protein [Mucilaginibacter sp. X4EP1]MCS3812409.1 cytoskeletal protein RodZ [Mucilaginibacter sp. X4EP1]